GGHGTQSSRREAILRPKIGITSAACWDARPPQLGVHMQFSVPGLAEQVAPSARLPQALGRRAALAVAVLLLASIGFAQRPVPLSGVIVNPTGAEGTISAWGGYLDAGAQSTVALGTVAPDGAFTLELPGTIAPTALGEVDITGLCVGGGGDMTVTPARFGHMVVNFLLAFETSEPVGA